VLLTSNTRHDTRTRILPCTHTHYPHTTHAFHATASATATRTRILSYTHTHTLPTLSTLLLPLLLRVHAFSRTLTHTLPTLSTLLLQRHAEATQRRRKIQVSGLQVNESDPSLIHSLHILCTFSNTCLPLCTLGSYPPHIRWIPPTTIYPLDPTHQEQAQSLALSMESLGEKEAREKATKAAKALQDGGKVGRILYAGRGQGE
jgi:hypothetical protein